MTRHQRAPNKTDFLLKSNVCFLEQISSTLLTHLPPKKETTTTSKTCFVITTLQEMLLTHLWLTVKSGKSGQHLGRRILSATQSSSPGTKKIILQGEVSKCIPINIPASSFALQALFLLFQSSKKLHPRFFFFLFFFALVRPSGFPCFSENRELSPHNYCKRKKGKKARSQSSKNFLRNKRKKTILPWENKHKNIFFLQNRYCSSNVFPSLPLQ
jgi:hypothetical protein